MFILYVVGGKCKFRMVKYQNFFLFDDLTAQYIYIYIYMSNANFRESKISKWEKFYLKKERREFHFGDNG